MDKDIQQYFSGRQTRLDGMDEESRTQLLQFADESGNRDAFLDKQIVIKWLSKATDTDENLIAENADAAVRAYFGPNDNFSSAYDKLSNNYSGYSKLFQEQADNLAAVREAQQTRYEDRSWVNNFLRTTGSSVTGGLIGIGQGILQQADVYGQYPMPDPFNMATARELPQYEPMLFSDMADDVWGFKNKATGPFDVDPEFQERLSGRVASGLGSLGPQAAAFAVNPLLGVAVVESTAFAEATDNYWGKLGINPEEATREQREDAMASGFIYALPSTAWNVYGMDKILKTGFAGAAKGMTKKEILKQMPKTFAKAGLEEAPTEVLDNVWMRVTSHLNDLPDEELITADALKDMWLDAAAAFLTGGAVGTTLQTVSSIRSEQQLETTEPPAPTKEIVVSERSDSLTPEELTILREKYVSNGEVNEDAIDEMTSDPEAAETLRDALLGDEDAVAQINTEIARRDAEGENLPELTEADFDNLEQEIADAIEDVSVAEDGALTKEVDPETDAELNDVVESIVEELSAASTGILGMSADQLRDKARAMVSEMQMDNSELVALQVARETGLGKANKAREKVLIERMKGRIRAMQERIYGQLMVSKTRAQANQRLAVQYKRLRDAQVARIKKIYAKRDAKSLKQKIDRKIKTITKNVASAQAARKRLGISKEYLDAFNSYVKKISEQPSEIEMQQYNELIERMDSEDFNGVLTPAEESLLAHVNQERITDKNISPAALQAMWADINEILKTGRDVSKQREALKKADREAKAQALAVAFRNRSEELGVRGGGVFSDDADRSAFGKFVNKKLRSIKGALSGVLKNQTIGRILEGERFGGVFDHVFTRRLREAGNVKYEMNQASVEAINSILEEEGVDSSLKGKPLIDSNGNTVELGNHTLTYSEAMSIYAHSKNEDNKASMLNTLATDGQKITEDDVQFVIDSIPDNYKTAVDRIMDEYLAGSERRKIEPWFLRKFGVAFVPVENYYPKQNMDNPSAQIFDAITAGRPNRVTTNKQAFKKRTGSSRGFKSFDFFGEITRHVANVNHAIAYDETLADLTAIINDKDVKHEIERRHPALLNALNHNLQTIARGAESQGNNAIERGAMKLKSLATSSMLGYRISSGLKVFASASQAVRHMKPKYFLEEIYRMASGKRNEAMDFVKNNSKSAEVRNRYVEFHNIMRDIKSNESRVTKMLEDSAGVNGLDKWMFMRIAESHQTTAIWNAAYRQKIDENAGHDAAVQFADSLIEQTQQSGELANLPQWWTGNPLLRVMLSFRNDSMNAFNDLVSDMVSRGTPRQKAGRLVSYAVYDMLAPGIVLAGVKAGDARFMALLTALSAGAIGIDLPDEDKKKTKKQRKEEAVAGFRNDVIQYGTQMPVGAIPLLDSLTDYGMSAILEEPYYGNQNVAYSSVDALSRKNYARFVGLSTGLPGTPYFAAAIDPVLKETVLKKEKETRKRKRTY